jgi:thiamine pyrophosphokinase
MGSTGRFLIFLGGEPVPYPRFEGLVPHSILLACDSGIELLLKNGLYPDVFIGDLDSVGQNVISLIRPHIKKFYQFPKEKDKTDSELGVEYALNSRAGEIVIVGGLGRRLDHSLANIMLLFKINSAGVSGYILGARERVFYLPDDFELKARPGLTFSLIPFGRVTKLNISGVHYPLINGELDPGSSLGVSNYLEGEFLKIKKEGGPLFMVLLDEEVR